MSLQTVLLFVAKMKKDKEKSYVKAERIIRSEREILKMAKYL